MKVKKLDNGWRIRIGGVNKESFCIVLRYFNDNGYKHKKRMFRVIIDLNTDKLIDLFGFNEKVINISI